MIEPNDEVEHHIREAFAPGEIDSNAVDRVKARSFVMLDEVEDRPVVVNRSTRPGITRTRRALAVAAALATITTVAVAQPGPIDEIFGNDPDAAANRVAVLKEPRERHATGLDVFTNPDAYPDLESSTVRTQLEGLTLLSAPDPIGWGEPIEDELRTFIDVDGVRVVGLPTTRGNVCYLVWFVGSGGDTSGSCVAEFTCQRPVQYQSRRSGSDEAIAGVASDDVVSVIVRFSDGSTEAADVGTNAFVWRGSGDVSALVVSLRDGTTVSLEAGVPSG